MTTLKPLLPCPFCGGEAKMQVEFSRNVERHFVGCSTCGANAQVKYHHRETRIAWNRRAISPEIAEALQMAQEGLLDSACKCRPHAIGKDRPLVCLRCAALARIEGVEGKDHMRLTRD